MLSSFFNWAAATYSLPAMWAAWGMLPLTYLGFHIVERLFPAEKNQPLTGLWTNTRITVVYLLANPLISYLIGDTVARMVALLGGPLTALDPNRWFADFSLLGKVLLIIPFAVSFHFFYDFFYYWFHRMQHRIPWFWEQHKLHHTDAALNVTTSLRHHWLEDVFRALLVSVPFTLLLNVTPFQAGLFSLVVAQWGNFIHANWRVHLGPLSVVFCGPQVHRIHHSIEERHRDKNFAAFFPVWDFIFGTYHHPATDEFPRTGVQGEPSNSNWRTILFGPFIAWTRAVMARCCIGPTPDELSGQNSKRSS